MQVCWADISPRIGQCVPRINDSTVGSQRDRVTPPRWLAGSRAAGTPRRVDLPDRRVGGRCPEVSVAQDPISSEGQLDKPFRRGELGALTLEVRLANAAGLR